MSFILDALRKAEHTNRNRDVLATPDDPEARIDHIQGPPANWRKVALFTFAGGLLLALGLILGSYGNPPAGNDPAFPVRASAVQALPSRSTTGPESPPDTIDNPVAALRDTGARALDREARKGQTGATQNAAQVVPVSPAARPTPPPARASSSQSKAGTVRPGTVSTEQLSDYRSALESGPASLPLLHLDMHVYSNQGEKRFVFINLTKYRQGDNIDRNTVVESIEADGAIINHKGFRVMLRPD